MKITPTNQLHHIYEKNFFYLLQGSHCWELHGRSENFLPLR